jgi:hypothetical protein
LVIARSFSIVGAQTLNTVWPSRAKKAVGFSLVYYV